MNAIDNKECHILTLPDEVLLNIFERIPDPSLSLVCKKFWQIMNDNQVKQSLLRHIKGTLPYSNFLDWKIKGYSSLPVDKKVQAAYASFLDLTRKRNPTQYVGKNLAAVFSDSYFRQAFYDHRMAEYLTLITFCKQFIPGMILIGPIIGSKQKTEDKRRAIAQKIENVLAPGILGINFSFRNLTEIPREIGLFPHVTSLDISNNLLRFLPKEIGKLTQLTLFNAPDNHLEFIPETVWDLRALINFNVANNPIKVISEGIGKLENLVALDLSYLAIETLPISIGNLGHLANLHLHHNLFLSELPETIQPPASLRLLALNSCTSLQRLPSWVGNLSRLETLWLHDTSIKEIPELRSPELKFLSFPQNVSLLPPDMDPSKFPNLHTIKIYKCQISSIGRPIKRMFPDVKIKLIDKEPSPSLRQKVRGWFGRE